MIVSETVKKCIKKDIPFAFIRLPKDKKIYLIKEDKNGIYTYSFQSFDDSKKYTLQFSEFIEVKDITTLNDLIIPLSKNENTRVISENEYLSLLKKTIHYIYQKKTDKIVISREKWIDKDTINPLQSFGFLCKRYPTSFCHISYWNQNEIWMGATPEILGSYENTLFTTMALAGTLPDVDSIPWENKEIEEQKYVTDYIGEKIKTYASKFTINGPETLHLGHVKHLITYLTAELKNSNLLTELITSLHPTPAVCGIPLEKSRNYILSNEGYNRGFYAGYIGLETTEYKKYFVNLRCAQLYNNGALLYVGGGITAQSNPKKEWMETELKAKFIGESL
ncbi:isochorismate synthase [Apibacter mensalis]|uniref:isochorismate synthase n=1 Tax=Apibacter mensalis TaxID=1586267 RepID=A0A0X3AMU4_9FLAO|nr:isochorismate synthase [Apibacter mensalis]CVK15553.1 isochorismate synthase [Apibacter mensalis]